MTSIEKEELFKLERISDKQIEESIDSIKNLLTSNDLPSDSAIQLKNTQTLLNQLYHERIIARELLLESAFPFDEVCQMLHRDPESSYEYNKLMESSEPYDKATTLLQDGNTKLSLQNSMPGKQYPKIG